MARVTTDERYYKSIADSIREKTGIYKQYTPAEMPEGVAEAYNAGKNSGCDEGWAMGLEQGMELGKQEAYDRFWDDYQQNGDRTDYVHAFGACWTAETFRPKYDMVVRCGFAMFRSWTAEISLKQALMDAGVSLTFDNPYNLSSIFVDAKFTEIGVLDWSTATRKSDTSCFSGCTKLVTIERLVLPDGQTTFASWFTNCTALENLIIEGTIGANNFNVSWSPLTHDSLMSIINALADKSSETGFAVTLGTTNLAKLTDSEKAIVTQKGWTLA